MSGASGSDQNWIDATADRFERAWRAGESPRIEDLLAQARGAVRLELLEELLRIERECRFETGEDPSPEEYRRRFPEDGPLIDAVFLLTLPPLRRPSFDELPPITRNPLAFASGRGSSADSPSRRTPQAAGRPPRRGRF